MGMNISKKILNNRCMKSLGNKKGEIVIESMLVMIPVIFVLVFLISLGFLLYQQWNIQIVADNVATKVAQTYPLLDTDIKTGEATLDQIKDVELYRYIFSDTKYAKTNEVRTKTYTKNYLNKSSFSSSVGGLNTTMRVEEDSLARRHIVVNVSGKYKIPFGDGLEIFNMKSTRTFSATGIAECSDLNDYISTVNYIKVVPKMTLGNSHFIGALDSWMGVIKNIIED
jgi:Flp pilus assembly protein TadG